MQTLAIPILPSLELSYFETLTSFTHDVNGLDTQLGRSEDGMLVMPFQAAHSASPHMSKYSRRFHDEERLILLGLRLSADVQSLY